MRTTTGTDTQTILLLAVEDRQGYSPTQAIERGGREVMTLATLLLLVEDAIEAYGEDAQIVTDNGDRYGARYGFLDIYRDTFVPAEQEDEL